MQIVTFNTAADALQSQVYDAENVQDAQPAQHIPENLQAPDSQLLQTASREAALQQLQALDVNAYGKTRNHLQGAVTQLSAAIENGLLSEAAVVEFLQARLAEDWPQAYRFVQQLAWREFFQQKWRRNTEAPLQAQQPLKTGWQASDYQTQMPAQVLQANTESALINQLIVTLQTRGYLHNHGRLYLASYVVHWLRVDWKTGADWMLRWLADGNLASNHFSWQWVASTSSPKPYIFNLENAQKFCGPDYDTTVENNAVLHDSYENLQQRLFPHIGCA